MRNAFSEELIEITRKDDDIILLAGDIGFRIFDEFIKLFPNKFINCGIAEQNMISVAAGLASEGKLPVVYTIVPFLVMRGYEQIRVDIGINSQKVILVGVGGGLAYDKLGSTHHSCEDLALMRTIPNLDVYTPFDPNNVRDCLRESYDFAKNKERASYIRLSKGGEKNINNTKKISDNIYLIPSRNSSKNFLISHGNLISKFLDYCGNDTKDISIILISKIDKITIEELSEFISNFKENTNIFFIEEHFQIGGLFEAISPNLINLSKKNFRIDNMSIKHEYTFEILCHDQLLKNCGINFEKILRFFDIKL